MKILLITENYYFGLGLSSIAINADRFIRFKKKLSSRDLEVNDLILYHLTNIRGVEIKCMRYIKRKNRLVIINDTYAKSDYLESLYSSITFDGKASIHSFMEGLNDNFKQKPSCLQKKSILTSIELSIVKDTLCGKNLDEIAKGMNKSPKNIYNHRRNAINKLGAKKIFHVVFELCAEDY